MKRNPSEIIESLEEVLIQAHKANKDFARKPVIELSNSPSITLPAWKDPAISLSVPTKNCGDVNGVSIATTHVPISTMDAAVDYRFRQLGLEE